MDTSEQYVKMCEKAEEIQNLKPDEAENSYFYCSIHDRILANDDGVYYCQRCLDDRDDIEAIWLPRQDQLQGMVDRSNYARPERQLIEDFYAFANNEYDWYKFISMEQLWLAFVMREKFGKVWNGKEWEK